MINMTKREQRRFEGMKIIDARSGKRIHVGDTIRYPREVYDTNGNVVATTNDDWTLLGISDPGKCPYGECVEYHYRLEADGRRRVRYAPVRGFIFKKVIIPT